MKATIISFRRGRKTQKPRHFIIEVEGIETKEKAIKLIGKKVSWTSIAGKEINGEVMSTHGNKGNVRAVFEKGLPGQAINEEVKLF